jgi:hypothetical protein
MKEKNLTFLNTRLNGDEAISVNMAFEKLHAFKYTPAANACAICSEDFGLRITQTLQQLRASYQVLCLNCMSHPVDKSC